MVKRTNTDVFSKSDLHPYAPLLTVFFPRAPINKLLTSVKKKSILFILLVLCNIMPETFLLNIMFIIYTVKKNNLKTANADSPFAYNQLYCFNVLLTKPTQAQQKAF